MGRERDQAISAGDYQRADELKAQIKAPRPAGGAQGSAHANARVTVEDIAEIMSRPSRCHS